jgi:hypothetical protein
VDGEQIDTGGRVDEMGNAFAQKYGTSYRPRHRSVTHICTCAGEYILYGKYKSTRLRVMTWESLRGE